MCWSKYSIMKTMNAHTMCLERSLGWPLREGAEVDMFFQSPREIWLQTIQQKGEIL